MAEAQQARVQNAVEEMVQGLERDHIRKMQMARKTIETFPGIPEEFHIDPSRNDIAKQRRLRTSFLCQGRMFRCSAECCERPSDSMSQVHQCIERCHAPLAQAQSLVTTELERFQDRLARCTMHCNDKAKDLFDSGAKEQAVRALMEKCVGGCVDEHVHLLPSMTRKLKDSLGGIPQ